MIIFWKKYLNFFELYRENCNQKKLIYIIGEQARVYVGSIGSRGGEGGLKQRYLNQYLERAKAIFGMDECAGVPSYAGRFIAKRITQGQIRNIEMYIQCEFILNKGEENALFKLNNDRVFNLINLNHQGQTPPFVI